MRVPQEIKFHSGIEFADSGVSPKMLQVLGTWQTHESQTISWPLWEFDPCSSPGHLRPFQTISWPGPSFLGRHVLAHGQWGTYVREALL